MKVGGESGGVGWVGARGGTVIKCGYLAVRCVHIGHVYMFKGRPPVSSGLAWCDFDDIHNRGPWVGALLDGGTTRNETPAGAGVRAALHHWRVPGPHHKGHVHWLPAGHLQHDASRDPVRDLVSVRSCLPACLPALLPASLAAVLVHCGHLPARNGMQRHAKHTVVQLSILSASCMA